MKTIKEGKAYYFYDNRAEYNVCKAHVLKILSHPERENDRLIVYRWYDKHRRYWRFGVTSNWYQRMSADYVKKVVQSEKEKRKCRQCGQCGFYMAYAKSDGTKDHYGDCASIGMNNESNEGNNHFKDPDEELLQIDSTENACGFFKTKQTRRVKEYIKTHQDLYYQGTTLSRSQYVNKTPNPNPI